MRFLNDMLEVLKTGKSTPTLRRWMDALGFVMDEKFSVLPKGYLGDSVQ
jgi:hypothetical protein